jgi:hypothetical protein
MGARSGELVATDESTVITKPGLDSIVVEEGESDSCLPNPPCSNESDRFEVFGKTNKLLDQFVTSEKIPGWRRR